MIKFFQKILLSQESKNQRLFAAVEAGNILETKCSLEIGADVKKSHSERHNPLELAIRQRHTEIVRHLLEAGAPVEFRNAEGLTPLHVASYAGDEEIVMRSIRLFFGNILLGGTCSLEVSGAPHQ
jgi:ankyrin repeat protein